MSKDNARRRIDVAEAAQLILERMPDWGTERVAIDKVHGEVLRQTISAERDQPPFDRVTMDGIAIRHAAIAAGVRSFLTIGASPETPRCWLARVGSKACSTMRRPST